MKVEMIGEVKTVKQDNREVVITMSLAEATALKALVGNTSQNPFELSQIFWQLKYLPTLNIIQGSGKFSKDTQKLIEEALKSL